jgi:hypothetical protein
MSPKKCVPFTKKVRAINRDLERLLSSTKTSPGLAFIAAVRNAKSVTSLANTFDSSDKFLIGVFSRDHKRLAQSIVYLDRAHMSNSQVFYQSDRLARAFGPSRQLSQLKALRSFVIFDACGHHASP